MQVVHGGEVLAEDSLTVKPQVLFELERDSTSEGDKLIRINVLLSEASHKAVTVPFSVAGSALGMRSRTSHGLLIDVRRLGADYTIDQRSMRFAPGETLKTIELYVPDGSQQEGAETIERTLGKARNAVLGDITRHTLTIVANDFPRRRRDFEMIDNVFAIF